MYSRLRDHIDFWEDAYVRTLYSPYAKNQVSRILRLGIDDQAVSRKEVEAVTIDGATSLDLDDAIWAEKTKSGYCIWIHISDVSEAIPIFTPLDREALQRTTSIYRKDNILDMIPPELSNNVLSLDPIWGKKLTMTLQIDFDENLQVKSHNFYESRFTNLKRYDYESFGEDFTNPESTHFSTLQLFKEISDKLRAQRLERWWILDFQDGDRNLSLWKKEVKETHISYSAQVAHNIIEAFMVQANWTTGTHIAHSPCIPGIYKRHDNLKERSYYNHVPDSLHTGLGIPNYTHFTSPIRRYIDLVIHRIIKSILRNEDCPYRLDDTKLISQHVNNTRWKIDVYGWQIDREAKGVYFMERARERLWRPLEVYDMKVHIRNTTEKSLSLPKVMKDSIIERIENGNMSNWTWAVGIILLWKDKELKQAMSEAIVGENKMSPMRFLSVLKETRVTLWEESIFEIDETEDATSYTIKILCKWKVVAKWKGTIKQYGDIWHLRYESRKKAIKNLFDYFIDL